MKKLIALTLIFALTMSLAACGAATQTPEASTAGAAPDTTVGTEAPVTVSPATSGEPATQPASPEMTTPNSTEDAGTKILVVYFSSANTVDAVSSATPYFDGVASTAVLANLIAEQTGANLAKLTPATDYPEGYNDTADQAKQEQNNNARPAFLPMEVNPEDYDVIFVGYPMWWYSLPMIMDTFFDTYDFSGKTLVPFNTHEGSQDGGTWKTISELEPGATVLDGFAVRGSSAAGSATREDLIAWLSGLDLD